MMSAALIKFIRLNMKYTLTNVMFIQISTNVDEYLLIKRALQIKLI